MLSLPEKHELIGLFECEPKLLDPDDRPWIYNELTFDVIRGEDTLRVSIWASFREIKIDWKKSGKQVLKMKVADIDSLTVEMQTLDELLCVTGSTSKNKTMLKLRIKPSIFIEFEQQPIT